MKNSSKNIISLLTIAPFPIGNVSTLRYSSYLNAFTKKGYMCNVIIYRPTSMAAHQKDRSGIYNNIRFQYATIPYWRKRSFLKTLYYIILGLLKSSFYIIKFNTKILILYGDNPFIITLFYKVICSLFGIKYYGDRSEYPSQETRNSRMKCKIYGLKQSLFDGLIVMTKELVQYYSKFSKKSNFIFFLPMTIDVNRYNGIRNDILKENYIAVVFGTHNRDGLYESLLSYIYYRKKLGGTFNLMIIGDFYNMPNKKQLEKIINDSSIHDFLIIKGLVQNDVVPYLLKNAKCLLTTPNYYISGGFPTKLGEYMLSGVPIVATNAGEILEYVARDIEILISEPKDIKSIANNILFVEQNPSIANKIAEQALIKAQTIFNADNYINQLIYYLNNG